MDRVSRQPLRFPALPDRVERVLAVLVPCSMFLLFGWCTAARWGSAMDGCLRRYQRAHTAACGAREARASVIEK